MPSSLFTHYKDYKKQRLACDTRHIIWVIWRRGAKPLSCIIPPFEESQTCIYVSYGRNTNLSYNRTSATARTKSRQVCVRPALELFCVQMTVHINSLKYELLKAEDGARIQSQGFLWWNCFRSQISVSLRKYILHLPQRKYFSKSFFFLHPFLI